MRIYVSKDVDYMICVDISRVFGIFPMKSVTVVSSGFDYGCLDIFLLFRTVESCIKTNFLVELGSNIRIDL